MDLLPQARDIEKDSKDPKDLKFNNKVKREELLQITAGLIYTPDLVKRDPEAATLFMKYYAPKEKFAEYLELKFVDDGSLPDIKLNVYSDAKGKVTISSPSQGAGKELKKIYTIEKLSSKAEAALLGHFTGCCQHLWAEGRECTIYGITRFKSGFYVVRNPKGEIIAQTWAWQSEGVLVFDSIEFNEAAFGRKPFILSSLFRELAEQIMQASGTKIKEVRVGTGGKTPINCGINFLQPRQPVSPPSFSEYAYRDSKIQRQLTMSLDDLCKKLGLKECSSEEKAFHAEIKTAAQWVALAYYFKINHVSHPKWPDLINKMQSNIIKSANDFYLVLSVLSPDQCTIVYQAFKDHLADFIKTAADFNRCWYFFLRISAQKSVMLSKVSWWMLPKNK